MTDNAQHLARREQLEILSRALYGTPAQEDEATIAWSPLQVIVLSLSMADLLDRHERGDAYTCDHPGLPAARQVRTGRLNHACAQAMALLREAGESAHDAAALLETAKQALPAAGLRVDQIDPATCQAWLSLLDEEIAYVRSLLRP